MPLFSEEELPPGAQSTSAKSNATAPPPAESEYPTFDSLPLAARMRPRTFDEFAGQRHLVAPTAPLRRAIEADHPPSCLFFGPAGTGKTTLARLCARLTRAHFNDFSAVTGGVADVRRILGEARQRRQREQRRTILFVDEIHRFNRAQQDAFLPHVEDGTITLIGATTENPLATVNTPLLSRCRLFRFEPISDAELLVLLKRALGDERGLLSYQLEVEDAALGHLVRTSLGDARTALGALEMAADLARPSSRLTLQLAEEAIGRRALDYDKAGDNHYHVISAYIKSMRGSDPDAAIFWMVRMLDCGEDPMFIGRRLVIQAAEDVGNADPLALVVATAALQAVEKVGLPEAAIPLAQATLYLASAPKSNEAYMALARARTLLTTQAPPQVPMHLRQPGLVGASERLGDGAGYVYPHSQPGHFVKQEYLPVGFKTEALYRPRQQGLEAAIADRLRGWWGDEQTEEPYA